LSKIKAAFQKKVKDGLGESILGDLDVQTREDFEFACDTMYAIIHASEIPSGYDPQEAYVLDSRLVVHSLLQSTFFLPVKQLGQDQIFLSEVRYFPENAPGFAVQGEDKDEIGHQRITNGYCSGFICGFS
jgi:hypothetical protein